MKTLLSSLLFAAFFAAPLMADDLKVDVRAMSEHPLGSAKGIGINPEWTWVRIVGGDEMTVGYRLTFNRKDGTRFPYQVPYRMPFGMTTEVVVHIPRSTIATVDVDELTPKPAKRFVVE